MNKLALFSVFICGILFAFLLSFLQKSLIYDTLAKNSALGVLPAGIDLNLMDDGYVAMAKVGPHSGPNIVNTQQSDSKSTDIEERNSEIEALNSLKAAKELVKNGKSSRAGRLFKRAYALMPRHADILIYYGEFLENHDKNVVEADQMYLRALAASPLNSRALRNRLRTKKVVEEFDINMLAQIDMKHAQLMIIPGSSGALRRIKKEAYFHYIYHTAAIEGNTFTLAETRMVLETRLGIAGKSILEHNEILGLDLALRYINSSLIHRGNNITLNILLQIHRRVLGHSNPLDAGQLRTTQVYVSDHIPPSPSKLQVLMDNFIGWLNSKEALQLHPIKYAALAHYKLVYIHPFLDGNGRTARLLMNFLLMQSGYPPVIIRKQDRLLYYSHLQEANEGDTRPFIRFIGNCADKTLDVYLWATKEHLPEIEQQDYGTDKFTLDETGSQFLSSTPPVEFINSECDIKDINSCGDYNYIYNTDKLSHDDDINSGNSWLHGHEKESGFSEKEYIQLKHYYKDNIGMGHQIKKPAFYFEDDDAQFTSRGR